MNRREGEGERGRTGGRTGKRENERNKGREGWRCESSVAFL